MELHGAPTVEREGWDGGRRGGQAPPRRAGPASACLHGEGEGDNPRSQAFSQNFGSILPTSPAYFDLLTTGP